MEETDLISIAELVVGSPTEVNRLSKPQPQAGELKIIERKNRKITMQATGKTGFGAWKIIKNEPLSPQ
ncbi:MAG: hypothetical protein ACE5KO_00095 [Candidatus Bathyarchaeia archaeon]